MFQVRWEFDVPPERAGEFAAAYGPEGPWVQLFKAGAGYLGTELSQTAPTRWMTIDRWETRAAYERFHATHADAYAALDERGASLTIAERKIDESGD